MQKEFFYYFVSMPKKEAKIQVRIATELRERLDHAVNTTGVPEPVIVSRCVEAYCDYVEQTGEVTFPLILKPKSAEATAQSKRRTA